MLYHVGTSWREGWGKRSLPAYRVVSEMFPKANFSNLSITIKILETINSKNNQSFLDRS